MQKIKTVLFDLDGTLLWMDQEKFVKLYVKALCEELLPFGYAPDITQKALWGGMKAMVLNDGKMTNEELFWQVFQAITGKDPSPIIPVCDAFYTGNFEKAQPSCKAMEGTKEMILSLRNKGIKTVLATNPVFPIAAIRARLAWAGLSPQDFDYVTSYSTERACKPNPKFFSDLMEKLCLIPEETLLVGNDELEDMYAGKGAKLEGFLVTDCLIENEKHPHGGKRGAFAELKDFLSAL